MEKIQVMAKRNEAKEAIIRALESILSRYEPTETLTIALAIYAGQHHKQANFKATIQDGAGKRMFGGRPRPPAQPQDVEATEAPRLDELRQLFAELQAALGARKQVGLAAKLGTTQCMISYLLNGRRGLTADHVNRMIATGNIPLEFVNRLCALVQAPVERPSSE